MSDHSAAGHTGILAEFTPDSEASGSTRRLAYLDGIRALCAIYVVLEHLVLTQRSSIRLVNSVLDGGDLPVGIFIVLSGYSLTIASHRRTYPYWDYMRRRAWRILPPYFAALVISVILILTVIGTKTGTHWDSVLPLSWKGAGINAVLLQDFIKWRSPNHVFWSIAVEWHLYFVFPLFLSLRRRVGEWVLIVVAVIGSALLWSFWGGAAFLGFAPQFLVLFLLGIAAADATHRGGTGIIDRLTATLGTGFFIVCVAIGEVLFRRFPNGYLADVIFGVGISVLLIALAKSSPRHVTRRLLESKALVWVGFFSYSLYLTHAPLIQIVWQYVVRPRHLGPNSAFVVTTVLGLAVSILAAFLFHLLFERPFLNHRSLAALNPLRARTAAHRADQPSSPVSR
jgi:peptidoglycan/LPS O-acetylase OafA/YrhL